MAISTRAGSGERPSYPDDRGQQNSVSIRSYVSQLGLTLRRRRTAVELPKEAELLDSLESHVQNFLSSIFDRWATSPFRDREHGPGGPSRRGRSTVPDVRGLDFDDAMTTLVEEGFRVEVRRLEDRPAPVMGKVVEQDPSPGTRGRRRSRVTLHVQHPRDPNAPR
jgi:hypothetical protein